MAIDWHLTFQGIKVIADPIAAASWPIMIGGVLYGFRRPLIGLIARIKEFEAWGAKASIGPNDQLQLEQESTKASQLTAGAKNNFVLPAGGLGTEMPPPHDVYDALDRMGVALLNQHINGDEHKRFAWAIRMRSISEANRIHEMHYRIMFGSQLQALKQLNLYGEAATSSFEPYFNAAAQSEQWKSVHENRTFHQWGQFLINAGYVEIVADSAPEEVRITPFGRQFLLWLTEARVNEWRPA